VTSTDEVEGETPEYVGLVLLDSVQPYLDSDAPFKKTVVALDLAEPFASVNLNSSLDEVQAVFERVEYPELPVLDESGLIVGFIRPSQVISEYYRANLRIRNEVRSLHS